MQFIYGALSTAAFFVCLYGAYTIGKRSRRVNVPAADEEVKRKAQKMTKDFQNLMNYNEKTALKGKG